MLPAQRLGLLRIIFITLLVLQSQAALQNITIDDTVADPLSGQKIIYQPTGAWNSGADCIRCTARPDESEAFNGTWHDSTFNSLPGSNDYPNTVISASAAFNGTAVYVVCILARTTSGPTGNSDMTFLIDGDIVGTFVKPAPGTTGFDYNVTVYSNTSLAPGTHTITVQNGHVNGPKSLVILDRIVYTTNIPGDQPSKTNTGAIAGAVVGSVVFSLAVVLLLLFLYRNRRRRLNDKSKDHQINSFPPNNSALPQPAPSMNGSHFRTSQWTSSNTVPTVNPNLRATNPDPSFDPYQGYMGYTVRGTSKAARMESSSAPQAATYSGTRHRNSVLSTSDAPPAYEDPATILSNQGRSVGRKVRI
ncbi:hypothetical protein D9615_006346 [Tricholomella constricta]|uniref:Transmembrane protein n=1 Tax=Tricholomella constricta TaxID=117010 RepID=A0A8H5M1C8_9AGAR|nr:hypothetical protein D9615_006346 [Tricholomella constricta]